MMLRQFYVNYIPYYAIRQLVPRSTMMGSLRIARDVIIGNYHTTLHARAGKSIYPSNEYTTAIFHSLENLLRVIVIVVLVVDVLLQVVVGVGLLKVLAEGSVSRVSTRWWLHNQKVSDSSR